MSEAFLTMAFYSNVVVTLVMRRRHTHRANKFCNELFEFVYRKPNPNFALVRMKLDVCDLTVGCISFEKNMSNMFPPMFRSMNSLKLHY